MPFIFVRNIVGGSISFEETKYISEATYHALNSRCPIEMGDILYSAVGSYGVAVPVNTDRPFSFQRHIAHIKPYRILDQAYLVHYLNSPAAQSKAHEVARGVAQKTVTLGDLAKFPVPLAPLTEQRRIVAAIEQQFTRLDAGVTALRRARAALKRYRAAVLKAAVEGRLTEQWRAEHPDVDAAGMLGRILAERRLQWEADLRARGKDAAKARYEEPKGPDVGSLPELPEGWLWVELGVLASLQGGYAFESKKYRETGLPIVRISNVKPGGIDWTSVVYWDSDVEPELKRFLIRVDDVLVAMTGNVGVSAHVRERDVPSLLNQRVGRFIIREQTALSSSFLFLFAQSQVFLQSVRESAIGIAQPNVSGSKIEKVMLPLPPLAEQEQIVAEVERRLSVVGELEATVEANLKRAERLRQSILREAFAGRLVAQDASDEPAGVLLERIRGERERANGDRRAVETAPEGAARHETRLRGLGEREATVEVVGQVGLWGRMTGEGTQS